MAVSPIINKRRSSYKCLPVWVLVFLFGTYLSPSSLKAQPIDDSADLSYRRGKALLETGHYEEAADAFRAASGAATQEPVRLTSRPKAAALVSNPQGFVRERLSRWHAEQAAEAFAQHAYLTAQAHAQRAVELDGSDRASKEIIVKAKQALKHQQETAQMRSQIAEKARAAEAKGHDQRAAALWKQVLKLAPNDAEATEALARTQQRLKAQHPEIKSARELSTQSVQKAKTLASAEEYRIAIGDVLEVFVWQQQDLSRDVVVRPDGRISFPLVGDITAANATLEELDNALTEKLKAYVKYPDVSLAMKRFGGTKTIVLGEVGRPGIYVPTGDGRALDVIAMAGGFSDKADKNDVMLIRGGLQSPQLARLDLESVLTQGSLQENIALQPNDILFVAEQGKSAWGNVKVMLEQLSPVLSETLIFQTAATNFGAREFERRGRSTGVE